MRTTVIPAQITTVEDKIAGNLSVTQILILMIPVFLGTAIYSFFPPIMNFAIYKLTLVILTAVFAFVLSLRIKGKIVLSWIIMLLRFNLRPKYYLFNKNDTYQRELFLTKAPLKKHAKATAKNEAIKTSKSFRKDLAKIEKYLKNPKYALSLKPNSKGGLYVALNEIKE